MPTRKPKEPKKAAEEVVAETGAAPEKEKRERPLRRRYKKQVTVRMDENLFEVAQTFATQVGWSLTDVVEQGVWQWLKQNQQGKDRAMSGRLLWESLPPEMQLDTYAFWSFCFGSRKLGLYDESVRRMILLKLREWRETSVDYVPSLRALGIEPPPDQAAPTSEGAASEA